MASPISLISDFPHLTYCLTKYHNKYMFVDIHITLLALQTNTLNMNINISTICALNRNKAEN